MYLIVCVLSILLLNYQHIWNKINKRVINKPSSFSFNMWRTQSVSVVLGCEGARTALKPWIVGIFTVLRPRLVVSHIALFPVQLMSAVKKGQVSDSRLAILMKSAEETLDERGPVTVDRSGGGVWARGVFHGCQEEPCGRLFHGWWWQKKGVSNANGAIWMTIMQSRMQRDEFGQIKCRPASLLSVF